MAAVTHKFLPQLGWGRGTTRSVVEGLSSACQALWPLHHSLRERSPSPSKLGEDL